MPSQAKTVYLKPTSWVADGARFALYMFGGASNAWANFELVDATNNIYKATFDDSQTNMIFCRMNGSSTENIWDNRWNQSDNLAAPSADNLLYTITEGRWGIGSDGNENGKIADGDGLTTEAYTEPIAAGYTVDFNTEITTTSPDFAVASNWGHIVGSNDYDGYGPYYMKYGYAPEGGVDGSGALCVLAQNGYYLGNTQSEADFEEGSYDYLITPKVNGTVTLQVKRYNVTGYSSYVKIFAVNEAGTNVGNEIATTLSGSINESDWVTLSLTLAEEQRLAIRAQAVLLDNFTAESATISVVPALSITSLTSADGESTTYFDMNADGSYTVSYKVKIQNTGEVDLIAGTTENYTLSVSIDGIAYGSFDIPVNVAVGETSEEFVANIVVPNGAPTGWKYRTLKENLSNTTFGTPKVTWSNTIAYNPVAYLIKKGKEPVSKGSSVTSETAVSFGMISTPTTLNYEIFANNAGNLQVKNIMATGDFTVSPANTLPYTIAAHTGMYLDITANATETSEGLLTITYVDKNGEDATVTATLSETVIDASKWIATFDDGIWPEGTIHQSSLSLLTNSYYGYDNAIKSSNSYSNKFFTPLLHATAGESMAFDAMLDSNNGSVKVYVTTDRSNLGEAVLSLSSSQLNTTSMTSQSVSITEEGDYYVVFEIYNAMLDNLYGFEKVDVTHDIMVNSYLLNGYVESDQTIQTGDVIKPAFEILPVQSETASAYSVKFYVGEEAVATAEAVDLTAGTAKKFTFEYTPNLTATATFDTYAAIEFTDGTIVKSPKQKLTITCEPVFVFFNAGTAVYSNKPSNRSTAITFGKVNESNLVQNFEIYNWGSAPLTVKSITVPEGFSVNVNEATVAPKERQAVNITFSAETPNSYSGNLTIVYVDKDGADQTFELSVSGTLLDPSKWYANFGTSDSDSNYPAGSLVQANVSLATPTTNNAALKSSSSTKNLFISPLLSGATGEKLQFEARNTSINYNGKVAVYILKDHVAAANTTTDDEFAALNPTLVDEISLSSTDFTVFSVTMPSAGNYYVAFKIQDAYVDEIYGLTSVEVGPELILSSSNIPTEAMQNVASTATVNILNLGLQNEEAGSYEVTAYVDGEATSTGEAVAIPMNHKLNDEGTQLSVNIIYPQVGTFPVYIEVKAGDYSVKTEPVDVTFAEEEAKSEADMAANGTTFEVPLYLNYKNSESITLYNAEALAATGISAGAKIKTITYKGYKDTDVQTTSFQVYYKWTDDQTLSQPATTYPYAAADNGMTKLIDEDHTWNKVGSSSELGDMIVLDFSANPLTYESGKSLVIYMHSYVDGFKSAYFEKSTLSSDFCYTRKADAATLSSSWSKAVPAAIHFALEATPATLSGTITKNDGSGLEGATITLKAENGVQYAGTTAADGTYSVNVIQSNLEYDVTIAAEGYKSLVPHITFNGESKIQDLTLHTFYGIVGDAAMGLDWDNDAEMTQSEEDLNVFTLTKNVTIEAAGTYYYKLRADHEWNETVYGYQLPAGINNKDYNFGEAGVYDLTFTANVLTHSLELNAVKVADAPVTITMSSLKYATLYYENVNLVVPEGLVAYAAVVGDKVDLQQFAAAGDVIPAGTPVVLGGEAGDYEFGITEETGMTPATNDLIGSEEGGKDEETGYKYYVLNRKNGVAGFYFQKGSAGAYADVKPHQAYLKVDASLAKAGGYGFDDVATGIDSIDAGMLTDNDKVYTLSGVRVNANRVAKGVYIVNGQKVVIK